MADQKDEERARISRDGLLKYLQILYNLLKGTKAFEDMAQTLSLLQSCNLVLNTRYDPKPVSMLISNEQGALTVAEGSRQGSPVLNINLQRMPEAKQASDFVTATGFDEFAGNIIGSIDTLFRTRKAASWLVDLELNFCLSIEIGQNIRRLLKDIVLLLVVQRPETNDYVSVRAADNFFEVKDGGPVPEATAIVIRAAESRLMPALDARTSLRDMLRDGVLTLSFPDRFQAENQVNDALGWWYKDYHGRSVALGDLVGFRGPAPVPGWKKVVGKNQDQTPLVTVIGAGVAGLTAATELVERGFRVQLVDGFVETEDGKRRVFLQAGGLAKTQYRRLPDQGGNMTLATSPLVLPYVVPTSQDPGSQEWLIAEKERWGIKNPFWKDVFDLAERLAKQEQQAMFSEDLICYLGIKVMRRFDPDYGGFSQQAAFGQCTAFLKEAMQNFKPADFEWKLASSQEIQRREGEPGVAIPTTATVLRRPEHSRVLTREMAFDYFDPEEKEKTERKASVTLILEFESTTLPQIEPWGQAVPMRQEIFFGVSQRLIPAEHGYRLFPSFYRHLLDTMSRVPLYDEQGKETPLTLLDNLVPPGAWQFVDVENRTGPVEFSRKRPGSFEDVRQMLRSLARFGYTQRDIALFELRLLRYLGSCDKRRDEAANQSWAEYLRIGDFSPAFQRTIRDAPLSLLAMKADEVDARTYLDVLVQLFLDQTAAVDRADRVLNGPTSQAFFNPWLDYLRRMEVRVFYGNLTAFSLNTGAKKLSPVWSDKNGPATESFLHDQRGYSYDPNPDYYVLAIPLERVWQVMRASQKDGGKDTTDEDWKSWSPFKEIWNWHQAVEKEAGVQGKSFKDLVKRDEAGKKFLPRVLPRDAQHRPFGPFRDMSGVQYFFRTASSFGGRGHVYYLGAKWGLSSISQTQYWRIRRRGARDGYISDLSVDVCDMYTSGTKWDRDNNFEAVTGMTAPLTTFAKEVWFQMLNAWPPFYREHVSFPAWFHIDNNLRWQAGEYENTTPYLINKPKEWEMRPGVMQLEEESPEALLCQRAGLDHPVWQDVAWGQWVVAGPHMKTYTRLTTMEAANESARHAVNRLLLQHASPMSPTLRLDPDERADLLGVEAPKKSKGSRAGGTNKSAGSDATAIDSDGRKRILLGDFVETWTMIDQEPRDFAPLRELDQQLLERGLPHMMEILKTDAWIEQWNESEPLERLYKFWDSAYAKLREDPLLKGHEESIRWLQSAQRKIHDWLLEAAKK